MVLGIKKDTLDDVFTVIGAVLIFNTLPQFQGIGDYFKQYPTLILLVGIAIIFFRKRIAESLGE